MYLATFWDNYGLIIILLVVCLAMMTFYFFKHKKQEDNIQEFEDSLKAGDRVKTYSGFYGEIANITIIKENDEQVKLVTLKLGTNSFIDVDIRAIAQIDKREVLQEDQTLQSKVAELRMKEDLAKRDKAKASVAPTFKASSAAKVEEKAPETPAEEKKADEPANNAENPAAQQPAEEKEQKRFVAKQFEKRNFSTKPKDDNADDGAKE